jgi:hypothetical protein
MHKRITGSRLAIIENAPHLGFAEQPAEFSTIVDSFLTERAVVRRADRAWLPVVARGRVPDLIKH